jgi:small GTP-binding protein
MFTKARKVVLLGPSGVGKTSIFTQWTTNSFNPNETPTIGGMNAELRFQFHEKTVEFVIWDTAGQERFHSITPFYLRGTDYVVIVVAWNDRTTFKTIPDWITLVNDSVSRPPEIPKLLVINKSDLSAGDTEEVVATAETYREHFVEIIQCSAKTGENITAILSRLAQVICERETSRSSEELSFPNVQDPPLYCC